MVSSEGKGEHCFIIAEAGVNHNGDIKTALKLIDAAADAGADAIKFQTFKASKLITKAAPKATYQTKNTGTSESQYEMLLKLELSSEAFVELKKYCDSKNLIFLSTPFDFESADLLKSLDIPIYKISSGDLTNIPFIRHIAGFHRPMILSTGMATMEEIEAAIKAVNEEGNYDVTILHCTTNYPTAYNEVNLRAMQTIRETFKAAVGYSDHTLGIEVPIAAAALGAKVIEKHFTLDRSMHGPDHKASLEPEDLEKMVSGIRNIEQALGNGLKEPTPSEMLISPVVRKSVYSAGYIKKGQKIKAEDLCIKRPGNGIAPVHLTEIIGKIAKHEIGLDEQICWDDFE